MKDDEILSSSLITLLRKRALYNLIHVKTVLLAAGLFPIIRLKTQPGDFTGTVYWIVNGSWHIIP
jgi:hypothetical protein